MLNNSTGNKMKTTLKIKKVGKFNLLSMQTSTFTEKLKMPDSNLKLGKQWLNKRDYRVTVFIDDVQYLLPSAVGAVWSDRTLASKETAFAKGDSIVRIKGVLYRVGEKSARPLTIKKGEFIKRASFLESPTAWLVHKRDDLYNHPETRTNDQL